MITGLETEGSGLETEVFPPFFPSSDNFGGAA